MSEKCKAALHIGDDYGDNHATMICGLDKNHKGYHIEQWGGDKIVMWVDDERDSE